MRLAGLAFFRQAQVGAGQGGGQGDIRVAVHAWQTVFNAAGFGFGVGHADAAGAVVVAPLHIDRRGVKAHQAAVAVHKRGEQGNHLRQVFLHAADGVQKRLAGAAVRVGKHILAGLPVFQAHVDVHGRARLVFHRLGHEGGVHIVADGRLAHRALEQEHLVGQVQRVAMQEVDFHLAGAHFVNQRVDGQILCVAVVVDVLEHIVVLVHRVDRVGLASGFRAAGAAQRRLQRQIGIAVDVNDVELHLRRHHRLPAHVLVQLEHAAQHIARRQVHRRAVAVVAIVNHLRHRVFRPGHQADAVGVGQQDHVRVGGRGDVVGKFAGHGLHQHRLGQAHAFIGAEFFARHDLAAGNAGEIRRHAFHFGDLMLFQPFAQLGHGASSWVGFLSETLTECDCCIAPHCVSASPP